MCAAANLTAFTYWPAVEPHIPDSSIQNYSTTNFLPDSSKSKFLRQSMFFFNNITKQEFFPAEKAREGDSKHFLTPLNSVQFPNENSPKKENAEVKIKKDSSEKVRPYFCDECGKSFLLKHHLTTHARTHTGIRPHAFPVKRHLTTHSKFHAGERPFVCEDCGESFAQKDHLVMHSRFHGSLNSFACGDCGATFTRKFELVNHGRLHGKQPHSCVICNKEFFQKRTLVAHMRCHTGDYPFSCSSCGESFQAKQDLTSHIKSNHSSNSQIKQICNDCGCLFNTPEALALHVKLHSGDSSLVNDLCVLTSGLNNTNFSLNVQNSNKGKSYVCQHCSKGYSAKHGLQQHNKKHPDGSCALRSHVCNVCSKGFFQKNHLLLHQRQHMDPSDRNKNGDFRAQDDLKRCAEKS
ncbi:gastrula zinc finger protein XlCGF8.2DB-like [Asbolus verrucosus]|uniref:Gastrula zinc finger protein XlCGF8.2DB-like n=1 Tax=Asbolus verrucosus TaxID=1661398 RepID=A0A482WBB1_ASBVE|nr:gastrula zinc finger protein XlCGF8.2DB-like [Asbolus verrucosus]